MRIITGIWRGRRLEAPAGTATRPTGERARESLFNILSHGQPELEGCRFLDLFAGSGAVGLEAASRGAAEVLLVEHDRAAIAAIRANLDMLGDGCPARLLVADAGKLGTARTAYDIVFMDPPYTVSPESAVRNLVAKGWLAQDGLIVVEQQAKASFKLLAGLEIADERRYGIAKFLFLRRSAAVAPPEDAAAGT